MRLFEDRIYYDEKENKYYSYEEYLPAYSHRVLDYCKDWNIFLDFLNEEHIIFIGEEYEQYFKEKEKLLHVLFKGDVNPKERKKIRNNFYKAVQVLAKKDFKSLSKEKAEDFRKSLKV